MSDQRSPTDAPGTLRVLLAPHFRTLDQLFSPEDLARVRGVCDLVWAKDDPLPQDVLEDELDRLDVIISASLDLSADQIARAKRLRAVIEIGGTFQPNLDYAACFQHHVRVLSASPAFAPQVAEMALAMTLASCRGLVAHHEAMRSASEVWQEDAPGDRSLHGASLGFIGFGAIARTFLRLVAPFGCTVRVYDPWLPESLIKQAGCEPASLDEVMQASDMVYLFAPPTHDNHHLVDRAKLAMMRQQALLVVISRAHLVDFEALMEAVAQGSIRAAIDVYPEEPLPADHPVRALPGVLLSSHRATSIRRERRAMGRMVADDLELMARGLPPSQLQVAQPELIPQQAKADTTIYRGLYAAKDTKS